jgi:hypothetical protein
VPNLSEVVKKGRIGDYNQTLSVPLSSEGLRGIYDSKCK